MLVGFEQGLVLGVLLILEGDLEAVEDLVEVGLEAEEAGAEVQGDEIIA
jgi:microcompartment protein CcmL/EutN